MSDTNNEKAVLSVQELADYLGIGRTTCYALIKENQFRTVRVGKKILIPKESVNNWLAGIEK